jgi:hypothetical protein
MIAHHSWGEGDNVAVTSAYAHERAIDPFRQREFRMTRRERHRDDSSAPGHEV